MFGKVVIEFCPKIITATQIARLCDQQYLLNYIIGHNDRRLSKEGSKTHFEDKSSQA